jgi:hypothetical protein
MRELFETGSIIDMVLALMAVEAGILGAYHHRSGLGVSSTELAANLLAGGCLLLALRAALMDAGWKAVAIWLAAALLAHVADLRTRWKS